ncbi:MAG: hypothetical protein RIS94_2506, partial [Pseudomonadota bacterium]
MIPARARFRTWTAQTARQPALRCILLAATALCAASAQAQQVVATPPYAVVRGTIDSYDVTGSVRTVTQSSARAVLEWGDLSVAAGETLQFVQPDRNSITLNRVTGGSVSAIDGTLTANGQVWILNPQGALVGASGQVSAAGFLATTAALTMSDDDFVGGATSFQFSNATSSAIVNHGVIDTANGYALLLGARVQNETLSGGTDAIIRANLGTVALGSGTAFTVDFSGDKLISFTVDAAAGGNYPVGIGNTGKIIADAGSVLLTARAAQGIVANVINTTGLVEARSAVNHDGVIVLDAGDGGIAVEGTIDASGVDDGTRGGTIALTGGTVSAGMGDVATLLDAGGVTRGGTITVRGIGGSNAALPAIAVGANATLQASAAQSGDGGTISLTAQTVNTPLTAVVWGALHADGGLTDGSGGRIELTAHTLDLLELSASAAVRGSAGSAGQFIATAGSLDVIDKSSTTQGWTATTPGLLGNPAQMTTLNLYDDQVAPPVPLGFTFQYMGKSYDAVNVSSNGFLSFSDLAGNSWCCEGGALNQPGVTSPTNAIFALWTDLISQSQSTPSYRTETLPDGSKRFIVGWYDTHEFSNLGNGSLEGASNSFEIVLSQNGQVQVNYGTVDVGFHSVTAGLTGTTGFDTAVLYTNAQGANLSPAQALSNQSFLTVPAGVKSQLDTGLVGAMLSGGTDVTLQATDATTGNLTISSAITKSSGSAANLSLIAANDVVLKPGANITAQAGLSVSIRPDSDVDGVGIISMGANIDTGAAISADGLTGTRYNGYFNDYIPFFDSATAVQDARFAAPFTAINTVTPGLNFGDNYSVRYVGYFRPTTTGVYTFQSTSDDASYIFLGNAGQSASTFQSSLSGLTPLVSDGGAHPPQTASGTTATLNAGTLYPIVVLFGEAGGGDQITVRYGLAGGPLTDNGLGTYFHQSSGAVNLLGNVALTGNATLTSQGGVNVTGTVNSATAGAFALNVQASGTSASFAGAIGGQGALAGLTIAGTSVNVAAINVGSGTVALNVSDSAAISGTITASSLIKTGDGTLALQAADPALQSVTINAGTLSVVDPAALGAGTLTMGGGTLSLAATSNITLANTITLTGDSAIRATGPYTLDLQSAINGGFALRIDADGSLQLDSVIGSTTRLSSFDAFASGVLTIGASGGVATTGDIGLGSDTRFVNLAAGAGVLNSLSGQWLVWSGNATPFAPNTGDQVGGLVHDYRYYGITGDQVRGIATLPTLPTGNGFAYGLAPIVSVGATGSLSKVYDGSTAIALSQLGLQTYGAMGGDTLSLSARSAAFDSADAGSRQITVSGLGISATDSSGKAVYGYGLASPLLVLGATITPRQLTASLTGTVQRGYDGTTTALLNPGAIALGNLVAGESLTVTQAAGAFASKDVGSGIRVSATLTAANFVAGGNTLLSNYILPTVASAAIGTITPLTLTYVAAPAQGVVGQASPAFSGTVTGFIAGENVDSATTGNLTFSSPATLASAAG